jgi:Xaa-Pro aminopeptidase
VSYADRLNRLGASLEPAGVDAMLVTDPVNVRYLCGYDGSNGLLVVRPGGAVFLTDFRYLERARDMEDFLDVRQATVDLVKAAAAQIGEYAPDAERIGFEAANMTVARQGLLDEAGIQSVALTDVCEQLRLVKDDGELEAVRRSAALIQPVLEALAAEGLTGRTERAVAWRVRELFHQGGAQDISFDTIVASGAAGALPHAVPRDVEIAPNTLVTVDLGCILDGYCSDCTRTFATGDLPDELAGAYALCLEAQLAGMAGIRAGITGAEADGIVRGVIEAAGHGDHFQHGTGHGVGLDIHEGPRLGKTGTATLEPGMIVTVEPGIYLPGVGGVRIEDLAIVTPEGLERLTGYPKELTVCG